MNSNYELIIFDCDGVLVNTETISNQVLTAMAIEFGVKTSEAQLYEKYAGGNIYDSFKDFEEEVGKKLPEDFESTFRKRTFDAFQTDLKAIPFVEEAIKGIPLRKCVGSNGPQNKIKLNLQLTGLYDYFKGNIYSAYDIQIWKPQPDLYLYAAHKMRVEPEKCIVVEDSQFGVEAGLRAGMRVFNYRSQERKPIHQKGLVTEFNDMRLLPDLVRLVNS